MKRDRKEVGKGKERKKERKEILQSFTAGEFLVVRGSGKHAYSSRNDTFFIWGAVVYWYLKRLGAYTILISSRRARRCPV
jgi:hypothetical protein